MLLSGCGRKTLAQALGIHYNTLCRKMRGEIPFTLDEALAARRFLNTAVPLEELFQSRVFQSGEKPEDA